MKNQNAGCLGFIALLVVVIGLIVNSSLFIYELQANTFAGYLLISDDDLDDMKVLEYSLAQAAACLGIPEEILRLRIK